MRQVLALAGAATFTAALLGACGGGDPFPIILGRYGPYPVTEVETALTAAR
jgi:hypothetical protein